MKILTTTLIFLFILGFISSSEAAALYKCTGSDGIPNYVNKPIKELTCTVVSQYNQAPSRPYIPPAPPATPPDKILVNTNNSENSTDPKMIPAVVSSSVQTPAATPKPTAYTPPASGTKRLVSGQVYSYMKDGVRHYSSKRPAGAVASVEAVKTIAYSFMETCYACDVGSTVNFGATNLNTEAYKNEIAAAARDFGVEEAVVRAIIHAESAFRSNATSHVGAQGLMQLMPATARRFGVTNAYDAAQNIRGGVQYLAWLLNRFNGDLTLAAAGYNAGEGAVDRHGGIPPYKETQVYVQRVNVLANRYRGTLGTAQ